MRICIVNPFFDDAPNTFLEVTGRYRHVEALAAALARRGNQVAVVQAFTENKVEKRGDVEFHYAAAPWRSASRLSGGRTGLDLLRRGNLKNIIAAMADFRPDAVHMNGITLLQPLAAIGSWCKNHGLPFTVSYHGGEPRRAPWLHSTQRKAMSGCIGAFFPTSNQARAWINAGFLSQQQVIECMEVSSTFSHSNRETARARTGISGSPVFVWNAGLHRRKDPITALRGFSLIRKGWPDARLYMVYLSSEMLGEVARTIADDPLLQAGVSLRGLIAHHAVQDFLNSADFFLQTSLSEIGSYSVLEAMSCGLVPIITDIPLFRRMTNDGRLGILFPVGNHEILAQGVLQMDQSALARYSGDVRAFFSRSLSYDAIAQTYELTLASAD